VKVTRTQTIHGILLYNFAFEKKLKLHHVNREELPKGPNLNIKNKMSRFQTRHVNFEQNILVEEVCYDVIYEINYKLFVFKINESINLIIKCLLSLL
jgi:hypothetical protein